MTSNQKSVVYKPVGLEAIVYINFQNFCNEGLAQLHKKGISSVLTLGSVSDN